VSYGLSKKIQKKILEEVHMSHHILI
jgi:hypothetical protein